ncbi:putative hydrolase [Nocardia brasiliensis NBRC 14402]|uniref:alpha/beta fold hydrolase n=1 Tax=Nocardia brasiliensis TaxID=37326 RepID=UPI00031D18BB|nr:alpha/beta hydrolase [Nocardia brasiliensis]ASF07517.1 alpha/beta hydrolase [Nocardia brasiliensis]GAJ81840.1 putative hydrolase [Nocardia brasiliensis NBRC 14402]SUB55534.1 Uncharacterized hydrolase SAV2581 [Nocardia brasiliensis]
MTRSSAHTLPVPGAELHYEVRGSGPLIVLVGAPMDAAAFAPLAERLAADHTVLTTDPRGHKGSVLDDPAQDSTPDLRADDLARLITHLDAGPATVLGSSGGAVTTLALVQTRPDLVDTAIAHEPPLRTLLGDNDELAARNADMIATYRDGDPIGAWRKFFAMAGFAIPEAALQAMFGGERDPAQVASEHYWFLHELIGTTSWEPDLPVLRATPVRLILGIGSDSTGQFCDRTTRALGEGLDLCPTMFPGGHIGFVDDPAGFETGLRAALG